MHESAKSTTNTENVDVGELCECDKIRSQIFERAVEEGMYGTPESDDDDDVDARVCARTRTHTLSNPKDRGDTKYNASRSGSSWRQGFRTRDDELDPVFERIETDENNEGVECDGLCNGRTDQFDHLCVCCPNCHKLTRSRSASGGSLNPFSSRQASRNKSMSTFSGTFSRSESITGSRSNSNVIPLSKQSTQTSLASCPDEGSINRIYSNSEQDEGGRTTSRSSICLGINCIPTHLFSLERFVSSELDSATEFFFNGSARLSDNPASLDTISSTTSDLRIKENFSNSDECCVTNSTVILSSVPTSIKSGPPFFDLRRRRKSFIEMSLEESLP